MEERSHDQHLVTENLHHLENRRSHLQLSLRPNQQNLHVQMDSGKQA
ncbi:MAG: hypothetical protein LDL41_21785 [Coleofasciculus sp. S288]|nr:hypothetical protein [Coleofasciculus sp. S288]